MIRSSSYLRLGLALAWVLFTLLTSCFTGVESTPKISFSDVKKEKIPHLPEQDFLSAVKPEPPAQWLPGKRFYIADPKISLIFTPKEGEHLAPQPQEGDYLEFKRMLPALSITGEEVAEIEFVDSAGNVLAYREGSPWSQMAERIACTVPFAIEQSVVDAVADSLVGRTFFSITPLWYDDSGAHAVEGLRCVPVTVEAVEPGNAVFPVRVVFSAPDVHGRYSMFMSLSSLPPASRCFHTLFSFDDPKKKYPAIKPDAWQLIQRSKVAPGMTRQECRLALGAPNAVGQRPSTQGMVEYWQYADGRVLFFQDDLLLK